MSSRVFSKLLSEVDHHVEAVVMGWPGYVGNRMRTAYLRRKLAGSAGGFFIGRGNVVLGPENVRLGMNFRSGRNCLIAAHGGGGVQIGNDVALNENVHLNASCGGRIVIGNDVLVGPGTVLRTADHRFNRTDVPIRAQGHVARDIEVGDDVWIAANVVIVGGVRVGPGAVIGAGAVVTKDVDAYGIYAGVPARQIGSRLGAPAPAREL